MTTFLGTMSSFRQPILRLLRKGYIEVFFIFSLIGIGAFPVKRNFPFLKHLGIRSILYGFLNVWGLWL